MRELKIILGWMKNSLILYLITAVIVLVLAFTRAIVPQFISYTIDTILLKQPSAFPDAFDTIIQSYDGVKQQVYALMIILILFQITRSCGILLRSYFYANASESVMFNLRKRVFIHLQKLPYSYYKLNDGGDIIQRCTTDLEVVRTFLSSELLQFIWSFAIIAFTLYQMIKIDLGFSLVSLSLLPVIFIISIIYSIKVRKIYNTIEEKESTMVSSIKENVSGVQVVKAFGAQKYEFDKYYHNAKPYYDKLSVFMKMLATLHGSTTFLAVLQTFIIIMSGIYFVNHDLITVGTLILFLSYIKLLTGPIKIMGRLISRIGRNVVAIKRINEIFEQPIEVEDVSTPKLTGDILFNNVSFAYPDDHVAVLKDVSFKIKNGSKVAIIGRTGSGKSTISYLLARLFDANAGQILINGHDITTINQSYLRSELGIVVQEPYLFSKKISENIAIKNNVNDYNLIVDYAMIANVHEDIVNFKHGYETEVGERGTTLSGGQKQRIAIARMLINNHRILVFDDSLSAVDNETDQLIRSSLSTISNTTTITITHRISSILDYDHVIVLEDGKVIEDGTIKQLLANNGYFANLYAKQVGDDYE